MISWIVPLFLVFQVDVQVYLNSNYVNKIACEGEAIWWATTGGVVCLQAGEEEYIKYDNAEGLLNNDVVDLAVDSGGYKYLLHRTEGITILSSDGNCDTLLAYEIGVPGDTLTSILIAEDKLIVGSNSGFSFDSIPFYDGGLISNRVSRVKFFDDTLWFCTHGGVSKVKLTEIEGSSWISYDTSDGLPSNVVNDLVVTSNGIWVATDRGVGRFQGSGWIQVNTGLPSIDVRTITALDTSVWVGTDNGIAIWSDGMWVTENEGLLNEDIRALCFDGSGGLWAGTWGKGIARYNSEWTHWISPGPSSNYINEVFVGRDGEVWCTHFEYFNPEVKTPMLTRFCQGEWTTLSNSDFGNLTNFVCGSSDKRGNRWFTAFGYGILEYTVSDSFMVYNQENSGLQYNTTSTVAVDGNSNRFFSFYAAMAHGEGGGVSCLLSDDSTWVTFQRFDQHTENICELALDSTGTLWLGSCKPGYVSTIDFMGTLTYPGDDRWRKYTPEELYSGGEIHALAVDRENRVWVGTANGIRIITFGEISRSHYDESNSSLRSNLIYDIEFDSRGGIWIGTDKGLNHIWANGKWDNTYYLLPNEEVKSIAVDHSEEVIWAGTRHGLCKISPDWDEENMEELLDMATVYPNPLLPTHPGVVVFRYVPPGARIRIYSLSGKILAELTSSVWDTTDESGARVASGVYVYHISYESATKVGKFAVIR